MVRIGPGQSANQAQRKLYIGRISYDMANDNILEVFFQIWRDGRRFSCI